MKTEKYGIYSLFIFNFSVKPPAMLGSPIKLIVVINVTKKSLSML